MQEHLVDKYSKAIFSLGEDCLQAKVQHIQCSVNCTRLVQALLGVKRGRIGRWHLRDKPLNTNTPPQIPSLFHHQRNLGKDTPSLSYQHAGPLADSIFSTSSKWSREVLLPHPPGWREWTHSQVHEVRVKKQASKQMDESRKCEVESHKAQAMKALIRRASH